MHLRQHLLVNPPQIPASAWALFPCGGRTCTSDIAIGSLLQELTDDERHNIHSMTLITNTNPRDHISYHDPWLHDLVDQVMTYEEGENYQAGARGLRTSCEAVA
jgi:hypothetical protein